MSAAGNVKLYSLKELRVATEDFFPGNKIGEGGFGSVYKGILKNGTKVALKVLSSESTQGAREFLSEITAISDIVHENLVKLYGVCMEGNSRILVYNYLENNSLAQTLLGSNHSNIQLSWRTRCKICIGVARGLAFLHEEVEPHIVHRDIKASNILLDKDFTPKISDFGLAKLLPPNATHVSTRVAGTAGYLAPEYAIRGQVTRKSDIYSFGVLLLEIVSGRSHTNTRLPDEEQFLLDRIVFDLLESRWLMGIGSELGTWALYEKGELERIIDATLSNDLDTEQACRFLKIGLMCTQDEAGLRPSMSTVFNMLTGVKDVESIKITTPGLISDFTQMKIGRKKAIELTASSSSTTSNASMTFTAIGDRE
ncbi:putative leucine-rich repeat receptor-like serine/threonine-protein kinase [Dendrobium catenatum]|uniref:Putative leucine-rich repeat receptor-like serine/threonine-protein kinase n=1 Tax=Dendrobium catenatum TaxID=906689 RepID=A0A2I0WXB6_9ASPA|nr:putative leucine-rich repeat receptor-like serine/threonine-protein kinase [Dendrobium catenatum]